MADTCCRVLITGATGMLGKDVSRELFDVPGYEVYNLVRTPATFLRGEQIVADLENPLQVASVVQELRPDCIVHCAALTDLDLCERDNQTALRVNVEAVRVLVNAMPEGGRFIYVSTDSVFDGKKGAYKENELPNPLNFYAQSKLMGECAALRGGVSTLVLRTNLYGFHTARDGRSLVEWAYKNISSGHVINGFSDILFNPLYTVQIAKLIRTFISLKHVTGLLNLGCSEYLSKYDFLVRLAITLGYNPDLVLSANSSSLPTRIIRPLNTTLDCGQLFRLIGEIPSLSQGLLQLRSDIEAIVKEESRHENDKNWQ